MTSTTLEALQQQADAAVDTLRGLCEPEDVAALQPLLLALRNQRDYPRMLALAEALLRHEPQNATARRLQAQAVIESGWARMAVPLLQALLADLPPEHPERAEAMGLVGRAWKQVFFDAADKAAAPAREALACAVDAYRDQYEADRSSTWHGVNLLALAHRARRLGVALDPPVKLRALAQELVDTLAAVPEARRDPWYLPTLAEATLGLGDWDAVEHHLRGYVASPDVPAFLVASTLRQFTEVWDLEGGGDARGRSLVQLLRARLLQLPQADFKVPAADMSSLRQAARRDAPTEGQLEAVLGQDGPKTYEWWLAGLEKARAVAAVKRRLGARIGTGFVVRAGDLGLAPADELVLLTNHHVVNPQGDGLAVRPQDAQVVFEALANRPVHDVEAILWTSPVDAQDATVLRLRPAITGIEPLSIAPALPEWPPGLEAAGRAPRVYIVGHPGGRELSFSFQDNEMLGHEGPPNGKPPKPAICRVHYRAPTEGGNSGSPVFDEQGWQVIALHHMGGRLGMPRLNGEEGSYPANEGIALRSIIAAIAATAQGQA